MTSTKPILVVDIDNTLFSDTERKKVIVSELLGREVPVEIIRQKYDLSHLLTFSQKTMFNLYFQQPKMLSLDEPIEGGVDAINELKMNFQIAYISGRPAHLLKETIRSIDRVG